MMKDSFRLAQHTTCESIFAYNLDHQQEQQQQHQQQSLWIYCPQCCCHDEWLDCGELVSPFVNTRDVPISIALRPTEGTYLHDYSPTCLLHIGLVNSKGMVFHFDEDGLHIDEDGWEACIVVPLILDRMVSSKCDGTPASWDSLLLRYHTLCSQHEVASKYDGKRNNCQDHIAKLLYALSYDGETDWRANGDRFYKYFVSFQLELAERYINIYRLTKASGSCYVESPLPKELMI